MFCFGQQDKIKLIRAETLKAFIYWGLTFFDAFETEDHGVNMPLASFLQDTWPHEELRWHGQILSVYNMWIRLAMIICYKRAYDLPMSAAPEPLPLWQFTADPYLHRRHSNTVLSQSLWGFWIVVRTSFVWALWAFLAGLDSKRNFHFQLLGFPRVPWTARRSNQSILKEISPGCSLEGLML